MGKKITTVIFLLIINFSLNVYQSSAAPSVNTVSANNSTIIISGSNFGSNSAAGTSAVQWLGDNIEAGTNGAKFSPPSGWGNYYTTDTETTVVAKYTTSQAHSGSKSLMFDYDHSGALNRYKGHIYKNFGSDKQKIYLTFWTKNRGGVDTNGGTTANLKFYRLNQQAGKIIPTGHMALNFSILLNKGNLLELRKNYPTGPNSWQCDGCANERSSSIWISDIYAPVPGAIENRWTRVEQYVDVGTVGNANGTFQYYIHDPDGSTTPKIRTDPRSVFDGNLQYLYPGQPDTGFSHFLFGLAAVDGLDCTMYYDDVFTQIGSQARVELGDASTWSGCTRREIQFPTSWSSSSITIDVNNGSFRNGDLAYLYVVDSNGNVNSNGYPITIGGGGSNIIPPKPPASNNPPNPPTGLHISGL